LVKNRNFGQKFWSKILVKNFGQKFWSKIEIFAKNRKFGQKVWSNILVKNKNFGRYTIQKII